VKDENGRPSKYLRDQLMEQLRDRGVQTSIHYPPVHLFSLYRKLFGYQGGMLPVTEEVSQGILTLPLHPRMGRVDATRIAEEVKEIVGKWS